MASEHDWSVLLINPNTSQWVTDKLAAHLVGMLGLRRADRAGDRELRPSLHRFAGGIRDRRPGGARGLFQASAGGQAHRSDAVLIGCFGDPGFENCGRAHRYRWQDSRRRRSARPGAPAAMRSSPAAGQWKPMLEEIVAGFGWKDRLDNITVIEQSGADLAADPEGVPAAGRGLSQGSCQRRAAGGAGRRGLRRLWRCDRRAGAGAGHRQRFRRRARPPRAAPGRRPAHRAERCDDRALSAPTPFPTEGSRRRPGRALCRRGHGSPVTWRGHITGPSRASIPPAHAIACLTVPPAPG